MLLDYVGAVDSDEEVLIFGDAESARLWRGSSNNLEDLLSIKESLRKGLPATIIGEGAEALVAWNIQGSGTVDVYQKGDQVILIRAWFDNVSIEETMLDMLSSPVPVGEVQFAEIVVRSGYLVVIAANESGECIKYSANRGYLIEKDQMMTETSGLVLALKNGIYRCTQDMLSLEAGEAYRCHIVKFYEQ